MKKLTTVFLGCLLSVQILCTAASAEQNTSPVQSFSVTPSEITVTEGETCRLTVTVDPVYADSAAVFMIPSHHKTLVSAAGDVTAYCCGEDSIYITVSVPDENTETGSLVWDCSVPVHVQPDETLPAEIRAELDRLQAQAPFGDYQRRTLELLGILPENTPRITEAQIGEILQSKPHPNELAALFSEIHGYPDYIWRGDPGDCEYWLDDTGSDKIVLTGDAMLTRTKLYSDGTVKEVSWLYPPEIDFPTIIGPTDGTDRTYIEYNQIPHDDAHPPKGDANNDGTFGLADAVRLEKWLLAVPGTRLPDWTAADFNADGRLNAADLTLMKRALLAY